MIFLTNTGICLKGFLNHAERQYVYQNKFYKQDDIEMYSVATRRLFRTGDEMYSVATRRLFRTGDVSFVLVSSTLTFTYVCTELA